MTIKDVEARTGLERANIRFYEKEGLLSPARAENGYWDYSEEDVQALLRIKLLRQVRLTLEEIKALQSGTLMLTDALQAQIEALEREREAAEGAQRLCRRMAEDRAEFRTLDAEKYLRDLPEAAGGTFSAADRSPQAFCPWRRYFARTLDLMLYGTLFETVFCLLSGLPVQRMSRLAAAVAGMVLMLIIEPLLLRFFGTTAGKFCFGLSIEPAEGGRLPYWDGLSRTAGALYYGMAFQIPLLSIYTLWKSYKRCSDKRWQPWEEPYVNYSFRGGDGACVLRAGAVFALSIGLTVLVIGAQQLAPNRGELTVAEFAENVNHYRDYYFEDVEIGLDESGQWVSTAPEGTFVINVFGERPRQQRLSYTMDGDAVTGVSFTETRGDSGPVSLPVTEMRLLAVALLGAEKEVGFLSDAVPEMANEILSLFTEYGGGETRQYSVSRGGVTASWVLERHGYDVMSDGVLFGTDGDGGYYSLSFSVEKE